LAKAFRFQSPDIIQGAAYIHASEDLEAALQKTEMVVEKLKKLKLREAARKVTDSIQETLTYYRYPQQHWRRIRTNNPMERLMREIRRRTKVVGAFSDGNSALMLCTARLRHVSGTQWGVQKYLNMDLLKYQELASALSS
jgi:transposase-like protein